MIEPAALVLGLVNVCAMVVPLVAVAPVIAPVLAPNVQANVLATLAVKLMLVALPLQTAAVAAVVTEGTGFTVTVHVPAETVGVVKQPPSLAYLR